MYQLLIVEDEKTIAQGIANSIPWAEWGFQIVGICYNGAEAVEFIKDNKPDIVLSDIRMPQMDGIALMKYVSKHYPEIKIIILSGYNDFEYLQTAIRSSVAEYLLKPTDVDEFEVLFRKLKRTLDEERIKQWEETENRRIRDCNALLKGYGYAEEEMEERLYEKDNRWFGVILFRFDLSLPEDRSLSYQQKLQAVGVLREEARKHIEIQGDYLCNFEEEMTGLLMMEEEPEENQMEAYAECLQKEIEKQSGQSVSCGISNFYEDFRMLPQCYEQTKCCINQTIFQPEHKKILCFLDIPEMDMNYYQFTFDEDKILKYILNQDEEALRVEVSSIFHAFKNQFLRDYAYVKRLEQEVLLNICRKMLKYNVRPEKLMNENGYTYDGLSHKRSLEEKQEYLMGIFVLFMKECQEQQIKNTKTSELAKVIKGIVDAEYMSNFISLEYIAEQVHKNTTYISKIFKNEFDCNFSTYVTEKRLEKSKELLENPVLKIYEISKQLGWADVSNYIKVFKKKYGISPDEYRRIAVKNG